jgi:hypothetical protein
MRPSAALDIILFGVRAPKGDSQRSAAWKCLKYSGAKPMVRESTSHPGPDKIANVRPIT